MAVERQEHSSLATVDGQGYAVPSPPLTTIDVQGHAISGLYDSSFTTVVFQLPRTLCLWGFTPSQSSSLTLWLLRDRSKLQVSSYDCRYAWARCPRALRPFQSPSHMAVERQEHASLTTVDVHTRDTRFPDLRLLRARSTAVLRLSTGRDTPSAVLQLMDRSTPALRLLTCRDTLFPGYTPLQS